ncbi:MAG: hypothetical protein Q4G60_13895 [bacterium]|nr:hypothetical protein [bacterium]
MNLQKLTEREKKALLLIHHKLDYHDSEKIQDVCNLLEEKKLFQTEDGRQYEHVLKDINDAKKLPQDCICCGQKLQEREAVICCTCEKKLTDMIRKQSATIKTQAPMKPKRKFRRIAWIAMPVLIIIIILLIVFLLRRNQVSDFTQQQFIEAYTQNIATKNFALGQGQQLEENVMIYPISPANDYLMTFQDQDNKLTGIALEMQGTDQNSRIRQLTLMSLIGVTIYPDMSLERAGKLMEQVLSAKSEYHYEGYRWIMVYENEQTILMVLNEALILQNTDEQLVLSEQTALPELTYQQLTWAELAETDMGRLLSQPYQAAEEALGDSVPVISDNTRYFEQAGMSCIYDENNSQIIYLDMDGNGQDSVRRTLFGLYYDETQEEALQSLAALNLVGTTDGDGVWTCKFLLSDRQTGAADEPSGELAAELSVTFADGQVKLICSKIVDR